MEAGLEDFILQQQLIKGIRALIRRRRQRLRQKCDYKVWKWTSMKQLLQVCERQVLVISSKNCFLETTCKCKKRY